MTQKLVATFALVAFMAAVTACSGTASDPAAATGQAIAFALTYQAENPRPTDTPWPGWMTLEAILTGEAAAGPMASATPAPSATPRPVGTPAPAEIIPIPAGVAPALDGRLAPAEWTDAGRVLVRVAPSVTIPIFAKQADGTLFVAFDALDQDEIALFPELLLDAANNRADQWDGNDWWFHLSTRQCQGRGPDALWARCDDDQAWRVTDFVTSGRTVEMAIPLSLLALPAEEPVAIGIAFSLMRLAEDGSAIRFFWPDRASLNQPSTWGLGLLAGEGG